MESFKRFSEEKLPDKFSFYSSVKDGTTSANGEKLDSCIRDEDYLTCKKIWNKFNIKNMGVYYDRYLKKDVLLLADVFEKSIDTYLKFYKLDPCHYFSSPGLSWDAILKMTGAKLEKILDIGKYLFFEKVLRGGISYIAKRYSKAKTKYMILNVELEYPDKLHVLHKDYPLTPEKLAIPYDILSDYCEKSIDEYEIKVGD